MRSGTSMPRNSMAFLTTFPHTRGKFNPEIAPGNILLFQDGTFMIKLVEFLCQLDKQNWRSRQGYRLLQHPLQQQDTHE